MWCPSTPSKRSVWNTDITPSASICGRINQSLKCCKSIVGLKVMILELLELWIAVSRAVLQLDFVDIPYGWRPRSWRWDGSSVKHCCWQMDSPVFVYLNSFYLAGIVWVLYGYHRYWMTCTHREILGLGWLCSKERLYTGGSEIALTSFTFTALVWHCSIQENDV